MLMSSHVTMEPPRGVRPLRRVEFQALARDGFFEEERVELLFGALVDMGPPDPSHEHSVWAVAKHLGDQIGNRAMVRTCSNFAASDISQPQPDVMVVPFQAYWDEHPERAHLVIEVSRTSLRRDRGIKARLYGLAAVTEYWIVSLIDRTIEVHRAPGDDGGWDSIETLGPGQVAVMRAFPDVRLEVSAVVPP